jgi:PAS domain S-box-containing protein
MELPRPSLSSNRKRSLLALRLVLTLAVAGVSLARSENSHPAMLWVLGLYALTNFVLFFEKPISFLRKRAGMMLFVFDLAVVTLLMFLSGEVASQFYVAFSLVILMAALTRDTRASAIIALVSGVVYGIFVGISHPEELLHMSFTTRIALFFAMALLSGYLAQETRTERETTQRLAEEVRYERDAHHRLEGFYHTLFNESADGVLVAGPQGDIQEANLRAKELLGRDPTGMGYGEFLRLNESQVIRVLSSENLAGERHAGPMIINIDFVRPDGTKIACEVAHRKFETGGETHHLFLLRDVGKIRDFQKWMTTIEKMSIHGQLVGSLTHEINNPLAIILGYTELLKTGSPSPQTTIKYVDQIYEAGKRCQRVMEGFLDQYRARPFAPSLTCLTKVVRSAVGLMEFHLRYHLVQIAIEVDDRIHVFADSHEIEQILINLMTNAVQAMKDSPRRILRLAVRQDSEGVVVEVADMGPGIASADMKHLFERGFSARSDGSGHGLGLFLCQEIAHRHGGRITVESQVGQGTTFTIHFPPAPQP